MNALDYGDTHMAVTTFNCQVCVCHHCQATTIMTLVTGGGDPEDDRGTAGRPVRVP